MKQVLFFALIATLAVACQQTDLVEPAFTSETKEAATIQSEELVETANFENYHAAISIETKAGEERINVIKLSDYPTIRLTDDKGNFAPDMDAIKDVLDYATISKHNEQVVMNQGIVLFNPAVKPASQPSTLEQKYNVDSLFEAMALACYTGQTVSYPGGIITAVPNFDCFSSTFCVVYNWLTGEYFFINCNASGF
ncbi:MAG: hypothetical protein AAF598_12540 [Bacteroidota bacterium]